MQEIKLLSSSTKEKAENTERPATCKYAPATPLRKLYMRERALNWLKNYDIVTLWELFDRRKKS